MMMIPFAFLLFFIFTLSLFKTRPIKAYFWFFPIVFGIMEWGADELRKWWNRAHPLSFLVKISW